MCRALATQRVSEVLAMSSCDLGIPYKCYTGNVITLHPTSDGAISKKPA